MSGIDDGLWGNCWPHPVAVAPVRELQSGATVALGGRRGLVQLYLKIPGTRQPDSIRPAQDGIGLAKGVSGRCRIDLASRRRAGAEAPARRHDKERTA
jgi:hypothetical protein